MSNHHVFRQMILLLLVIILLFAAVVTSTRLISEQIDVYKRIVQEFHGDETKELDVEGLQMLLELHDDDAVCSELCIQVQSHFLYLILSYLILSYLILSYLILSYLILSHLILSISSICLIYLQYLSFDLII
jgi:hypothetical protein